MNNEPMRNLAIAVLANFLMLSFGGAQSANSIPYGLSKESHLWLAGSATLGGFTCQTTTVAGNGNVDPTTSDTYQKSGESRRVAGSVEVRVVVHNLDCGNGAMNNDMYAAMKADQFSTITYSLTDAKIQTDTILPAGWFELKTVGELTIAGVTKPIEMAVKVQTMPDGEYHIVGKKELSMKDFGIQPPSAFWGLIKANEKLDVYFNFLAVPNRFTSRGGNASSVGTE